MEPSGAPGVPSPAQLSPGAQAPSSHPHDLAPQPGWMGGCPEIAVLGLELSGVTSRAGVAALFRRFCAACLHLDLRDVPATCLSFRLGRAGRSCCRFQLPPAVGQALLGARSRLASAAPSVSIDVWRSPAELVWLGRQRAERREGVGRQPGRADAVATWRRSGAEVAPTDSYEPQAPLAAPPAAAAAAEEAAAAPSTSADPPVAPACLPAPAPDSAPSPARLSPQGVPASADGEWELIEGILDQRGHGRATRYLVRFVGCGEEADQWLPAGQITALALAAWRRERRRQQRGSQPDSSQPDSTQPDSSQPDSSQPDSTQPDSSQPDSSQPDSPPQTTGIAGSSPQGDPVPAAPCRGGRRRGGPLPAEA